MSSSEAPTPAPEPLLDARGRPLRDLRISVTDRCNFRCGYCMPEDSVELKPHSSAKRSLPQLTANGDNSIDHPGKIQFLPHRELLSFEELEMIAKVAVEFGVKKLRLTGGEPLMRRSLSTLVEKLAALGCDLALTSNGALLNAQLDDLIRAGLNRITISLDALEQSKFAELSGSDVEVKEIISAIDNCLSKGLPVKLNTVAWKGRNDDELLPLARFARERNIPIRFIEYMDVGTVNHWNPSEVFAADEIRQKLSALGELIPVPAAYYGEVASRYHWASEGSEVGIISSVSAPFCSSCTRLRLSAEGKLYGCLFATHGIDLKSALRAEASSEQDSELSHELSPELSPKLGSELNPAPSPEYSAMSSQQKQIRKLLSQFWNDRDDRYSELRSQDKSSQGNESKSASNQRIQMSYIGG